MVSSLEQERLSQDTKINRTLKMLVVQLKMTKDENFHLVFADKCDIQKVYDKVFNA